jgi:hypothetical protein
VDFDSDPLFTRRPAYVGPMKSGLASARAGTHQGLLPLLVGTLFAANVVLHFPGTMNSDSVNQYAEAISGRYTDWHPPVMAWLWSMLRLVADGPAPFLLLHLALYWAGFGLLADGMRRAGHPRLALAIALAGAFPPFLYLNASVIKDVGMVSFWLAAVGLLFWFRAQDRRIPVPVGMVVAALVLYGALVRSNALFALGPLLMYALAPAHWLRSTRLMAAAVAIAVLAIPATQQANRLLFEPQSRDPVQSLFLFDLLGIAAHENDPGLVEPRATLSAVDLKACYTPYWWDSLSPWGRCASRVHRPDAEHATVGEGLPMQWAKTVIAHPVAYAVHRLKHFNSAVLFAVPPRHIRLTPEYRAGDPAFRPMEIVTEHDLKIDLLRKNPFVWPVNWMVWGAFLLAFLARRPGAKPVLLARVLIVSALGYSFAYLVVGVATDMRYHYWTLIAMLLATLLAMPQLAQGLRERSAPLLAGFAAVGLVAAIGVATRLLDFQRFAV